MLSNLQNDEQMLLKENTYSLINTSKFDCLDKSCEECISVFYICVSRVLKDGCIFICVLKGFHSLFKGRSRL